MVWIILDSCLNPRLYLCIISHSAQLQLKLSAVKYHNQSKFILFFEKIHTRPSLAYCNPSKLNWNYYFWINAFFQYLLLLFQKLALHCTLASIIFMCQFYQNITKLSLMLRCCSRYHRQSESFILQLIISFCKCPHLFILN